MKFVRLYLVTQWGNPENEDGANGPDTNVFVSAETFEKAVELGEGYLKLINGKWRRGKSDLVRLLGDDSSLEEKVHWDFIHHSFGLGKRKTWSRESRCDIWEHDEDG